MKRDVVAMAAWGVVLALTESAALADGAYFRESHETTSGQIAQTRQEVLLAVAGDGDERLVTYIVGSQYTGTPTALAWIIPVPTTPTQIGLHADADLFETLDADMAPRVYVYEPGTETGVLFACAASDMGAVPQADNAVGVTVAASGTAGIYDWVALSGDSASAVLDWLNTNDYEVPSTAAETLTYYITKNWQFLAFRVNAPETVATDVALPPIEFTCQTPDVMYPMVISRVSAAEQTEVVIYIWGSEAWEAENLTNVVIDEFEGLVYDANSPTESNYEALLEAAMTESAGRALVREGVRYDYWSAGPLQDEREPDARNGTWLTRMRGILTPEQMTTDFVFQPMADASWYEPWYRVTMPETTQSNTEAVSGVLFWLLVFGVSMCGLRWRFAR